MSASVLSLFARAAMAAARRLMPADKRELLEAMEAELATLDAPAARLRWSLGCAAGAIRLGSRSSGARFATTSLALLVLITWYDWRSADPTLTFVALVFMPGVLAYAFPSRRWTIGLAFGLWLLAAHVAADLWPALRPYYRPLPLKWAEVAEIALIVAITVPAALLGAAARMPPRRGTAA